MRKKNSFTYTSIIKLLCFKYLTFSIIEWLLSEFNKLHVEKSWNYTFTKRDKIGDYTLPLFLNKFFLNKRV